MVGNITEKLVFEKYEAILQYTKKNKPIET